MGNLATFKYWLYVIYSESGHSKIGVAGNVDQRLETLQTGSPYKLHLYLKIGCPSEKKARKLEKFLHNRYAADRVNREWFDIDPQMVVNELEFAVKVYEIMTDAA